MARLLFNRLYPIDEFLNEQLADDTIRVTFVLIWGVVVDVIITISIWHYRREHHHQYLLTSVHPYLTQPTPM